MRYFLYFLIISNFLLVACSEKTSTNTNACSTEYSNGYCAKGSKCLDGVCIDNLELCSTYNPHGLCSLGLICDEGVCKKSLNPCSQNDIDGYCDNENSVCFYGECKDKSVICWINNTSGECPSGLSCVNGFCEKVDSPCSQLNKNGFCPESMVCLEGQCRFTTDLCSENNKTGLCKSGKYCLDGECYPILCYEGQIRTCYLLDPREVNVGICREGVQFCAGNSWGECIGSITPQLEQCDGVDNNCDGDIDENVLNGCGFCGEEPQEIPNNYIDDNCDGKIDETDENPNGFEHCDGRTNQPCYTGLSGTSGKGICKGGVRDCLPDGRWGICRGETLPQVEICGDNLDNNCNGIIDENCYSVCNPNTEEICGNHKDDNCNNLIDEGCITVGREECDDIEICNNGFDDNCDGQIDENCPCSGTQECYAGDPSNIGEGKSCKKGTMSCIGGEFWGSCIGEILPEYELCDTTDNDCDGEIDNNALDADSCGNCSFTALFEICGDGIDNDCNDVTDENCPIFCIAEEEVCDSIDNDCDGLIDEGVVNACGTCGESCYEIEIAGPTGFQNGIYDGLSNEENPNEITLDSSTIQNDFIWIANSGDDTVHKINTSTGQKSGPFNVGRNPSRTAVDKDGSVWVGNRYGNSITKLASDGSLLRTITLAQGCSPRGLALDKNGNLWVGCYSTSLEGMVEADGYLYKINPDGIIENGYPYQTNVPIYGLAIDKHGFLWSSRLDSRSNTSKIFKVDTSKLTTDSSFIKKFDFPYNTYGIVIDGDNNIWFGGWEDNDVKKVVYNETTDSISVTSFPSGYSRGRGVAVDSLGNIWCSFSDSNKLVKYSSSGEVLGAFDTGAHPVGVGVDASNQIWVMNLYSHNSMEFSQSGDRLQTIAVGQNPYSYSDITGFNLRNIVSPSGTVRVIIDTNRVQNDAILDAISWDGDTPNGSLITARARISTSRGDFALAEEDGAPIWSEISTMSGRKLVWPNGASNIGRYIQIEIFMKIGLSDDAIPVLRKIWAHWQRD